jgi:hypothetical protein
MGRGKPGISTELWYKLVGKHLLAKVRGIEGKVPSLVCLIVVWRGCGVAVLWIICWHRSTQMFGWYWQTPGSRENALVLFERHDTL